MICQWYINVRSCNEFKEKLNVYFGDVGIAWIVISSNDHLRVHSPDPRAIKRIQESPLFKFIIKAAVANFTIAPYLLIPTDIWCIANDVLVIERPREINTSLWESNVGDMKGGHSSCYGISS